jgi:hypothetical protein
MATINYSFNLPTVGGSEDTWGTDLNANWTALDTLLGGTSATEFAILDGATVTTAELNILDGATITTAELNELGDFAGTFALPTVDGTAGQAIITDGSGGLSFATPQAGVSGPVSSTDNGIAVFDGTSGTAVKNVDIVALRAATSSIAIGRASITPSITGARNSFFGHFAGNAHTSGVRNSFFGAESGLENTTGSDNTAIGYGALSFSATASSNTGVGSFAAVNLQSGTANTVVGAFAGADANGGTSNIVIGWSAGNSGTSFHLTNQSNRIIMGALATNAYVPVAWTVTSDARDKTNFTPLVHGLDVVDAIETYTFNFDRRAEYVVRDEQGNIIAQPEPDGTHVSEQLFVGYSAQQVLAVLDDAGFPPDVVVDTEDPDNLKMKETALIPLLINAIKELKARVETLEGAQS